MVALWIQKPLEFSAFPTVLLVATILRLALNIATTRLILSRGDRTLGNSILQSGSSLGSIVTPLVRLVHGMRTQLDDLAEQVRVLKERPPAA